MTQTDLGEHSGITFQQIQKYEKGVNRVGAGRLQAIAEVFEVPVSFFFGEDSTSQNASEENTDTIFRFLNTARTVKLVKDFSWIKDPVLQHAVVSLVEKIAGKT